MTHAPSPSDAGAADRSGDRSPPGTPIGTVGDLEAAGVLTGKVGDVPVVVFLHDGAAHALEDRCPHLGFPLHRGTVEAGLVTCHWHHARFDLCSGCTLDPWADDARPFDVSVDDGLVVVRPRAAPGDDATRALDRLERGLEDNLTLVIAKAVLAHGASGGDPRDLLATGLRFGLANRREGWGAGLTVLVAMARLAPLLEAPDRDAAWIHGLRFLARDTAGHPPRFPLPGLGPDTPPERAAAWFRRFIDARDADGAERALATLCDAGRADLAHDALFGAVTDHVFIDEGHALDFTNKAFEALSLLESPTAAGDPPRLAGAGGPAGDALGALVAGIATATRSEERASWRHPHDLASLIAGATERLGDLWEAGAERRGRFDDVAGLAGRLLVDDPVAVVGALEGAVTDGATPEQLGRAVALAAGLRVLRFHTRNEHADWDTVHHGFTTANALWSALARRPSVDLLRGLHHSALRVFADRFLNIPSARIPDDPGDLSTLGGCFDAAGNVDRAGAIVYHHLRAGGDTGAVVAALGRALLAEDAGFHWYQTVEAAVTQAAAWPAGSEPRAQLLAAAARFLAAHTPTPRELSGTIETARRLRRGDALWSDDPDPSGA